MGDQSKFADPSFKKAVKVRPSVKITNLNCLDSLAKRFEAEESSCTSSKCINQFQSLCGVIDNLLYDKSACDKNDLVRKLNEVISGTAIVQILVELNEERIFQKIIGENPPSVGSNENNDHHPLVSDESSIEMRPLAESKDPLMGKDIKNEEEEEMEEISLDKNVGGISLEKKHDEESSGGISLDKNEDKSSSGISLDKSKEESSGGISLDKPEESKSGISLDKSEGETTISLDKSEGETTISLDKKEDTPNDMGGISLDKA